MNVFDRAAQSGTVSRVVLVSGIGKLHFVQAARDLKRFSPETQVVLATSWIPSSRVLSILRFLGLRNIASRLAIRREVASELDEAIGYLMPELIYHFFKRLIGAERALGLGFLLYGLIAARRVRLMCDGNTVVHVRSGAGFSLIDQARAAGATVSVDHSIAHPSSFSGFLESVARFVPSGALSPSSLLWRQVLKDCAASDFLIVNSDFVKQTFIDNGYNEGKVGVVYLGVPEKFFQIERKAKLPHSGFNLLFTGHFDARKGADILVRTMRLLAQDERNIRLHVAGNISPSGQAILDEIGQPDNIVFHGYVGSQQLESLLSTSDAFFFPTYLEGSARAVSEAMAAGIPVITSRQSGAPINDCANGLLLDTSSSDCWAKAILKLRQDAAFARGIGSAGRLSLTKYSGSAYASNLMLRFREFREYDRS